MVSLGEGSPNRKGEKSRIKEERRSFSRSLQKHGGKKTKTYS